ncbi:MAG: HAD family phosphatase [Ruminococcaceae bacterium]|nr:HAD family phosphatase [Oscillospiraceae bacterium]
MGKFDGILLVTDLDGTLLRDDKSISQENLQAIQYFESEGGYFTFATGRPPIAMGPVLEQLCPKIPYGCMNGAGVYDPKTDAYVRHTLISRDVFALVEYAQKLFPGAGFELVTYETSYLYRSNAIIEELRRFERLPDNYVDSFDIPGRLCKILIGIESEKMDELIVAMEAHPDYDRYTMLRTTKEYYEIMPKGCHKGKSVLALAEILGLDPAKTVAVGDNSNDAPMLRTAGVGIAVANATEDAKEAADVVLAVNNEEHAIANIVRRLEDGTISFG